MLFRSSGRKFNESLEDIVVKWVEKRIGAPENGKVVALSGMAFKGQPETSDLRGSSSVYIAEKLRNCGYHLHLHDFVALPKELASLNLGEVFEDVYDASRDASVLMVLNNHKGYFNLQEREELLHSKNGFAILDAWGVCSNLYNNPNIEILTLGNLMI